ncbi:response regulator [Myxococcota bacterium]|nr:response regulator [Myxococcota bacterium]
MSAPVHVLVVDDDERFRERLAKAFRQRGFDVSVAADRDAAIELARTVRFERAVLDLKMPGKNGLVLLRELRELSPSTSVVVLTGYGSIATAIEAIRLGATDYLTKPADADRILAAFDAPVSEADDALPFEVPSLASVEREHIERVLRDCNGNVSKAARVLGMHRRTLQYKLAKFSEPT